MISNAIQLKAKIRNLSGGDNDKSRALIREFFMEKFLERLSLSNYRDSFILKGGMLTASLIGINLRATMDIDATVKAVPLKEPEISRIVREICLVPVEDRIVFEVDRTETIMNEFDYPGVRVYLIGYMDNLRQPFKLDISTDDVITPRAIEYEYMLFLEDRKIMLNSYNIETLLAEKAQTVIIRGLANTGMRDFYDIYELTGKQPFSREIFAAAFKATCIKRGGKLDKTRIKEELDNLQQSADMEAMWDRFCINNYYAEKITWQDTVHAVDQLLLSHEL